MVNKETSKLILNHDVVFNEEVSIVSHEKTLFQKEPKGMKQTILLEEQSEFDIDWDVVHENIPFSETSNVQVNYSPRLFVDLPILTVTPRKVVAIPKVATRKSSRMLGTPSWFCLCCSHWWTIDMGRSYWRARCWQMEESCRWKISCIDEEWNLGFYWATERKENNREQMGFLH